MPRALLVLLLLFELVSAGQPIMVGDNRPPGPSPCNDTCASRLPVLSAVAMAYLTIVRHAVAGTLYNPNRNVESLGGSLHCAATNDCHTMVPYTGLDNFRSAVELIVSEGIAGDIVELGVWRGGATMYIKALLMALGEAHRHVHLFDVFDSQNLAGYRPHKQKNPEFGRMQLNSVDAIKASFKRYGALDHSVHFHEGLFNDTAYAFAAHTHRGQPIAVLRIDGNFYSSYEDAMYNLFPLVPVGGVVIFDDVVSHVSVKAFWNDFRNDFHLSEVPIKVDGGTAWFRKETPTPAVLDWSKYQKHHHAGLRLTNPMNPP